VRCGATRRGLGRAWAWAWGSVRSGSAIGSVGRGGRRERGVGHIGWSGLRQLGRPGEAAWAAKGFSPEANKNIEKLFYFICILFK
jgi:hypothetical protein